MAQPHQLRTLWSSLRSIKTTILALLLMLIIWVVSMAMVFTSTELDFLHALPISLTNLLQSPWFWLPVGLLLLNSLVALADYTVGAWQRRQVAPLTWQHPFATRVEQTVPTPHNNEDASLVEQLNEALSKHNFQVLESDDTPVILTALYGSWGWWGLPLFYLSLIILIMALLGSYYGLTITYHSMLPQQTISQPEIGTWELAEINAHQATLQQNGGGTITMRPNQLLQHHGYFIISLPFRPIVTISGEDEQGNPLRFIPRQENLPPAEQLHLLLGTEPLQFQLPARNLAFQLIPTETAYNMQVISASDTTPFLNDVYQVDEVITVQDTKVIISQNYSLSLFIYRDPLGWLYPLAGVLAGIGLSLHWFSRPAYVWITLENQYLYSIYEQRGGSSQLPPTWLDDLIKPTKAYEETHL